MGCDIHLSVEMLTDSGWQKHQMPIYDNRNYSLFSILAGVRNGSGFAGIDTGDPVVPISEPRGLPDDISAKVKAESDEWDIDGHSHSYLLLDELYAFDWDQKITHRAWIRRVANHPRNKSRESHDEFAARVADYANKYSELPPAQFWGWEMCGESSEGQGPSGWRTIEWREPFWMAVGPSWMAFLLRLARETLTAGAHNSRIVFFFDN